MAKGKKQWSEMSSTRRTAVVIAGAAEVVMAVVAMRDLKGRSADQIRGTKAVWMASFAVQPVGPIAYLLVGRRSA